MGSEKVGMRRRLVCCVRQLEELLLLPWRRLGQYPMLLTLLSEATLADQVACPSRTTRAWKELTSSSSVSQEGRDASQTPQSGTGESPLSDDAMRRDSELHSTDEESETC